MKVLRKIECEINNKVKFKIGDQIKVGKYYTATCQEIGKKRAIFMFDQYLDNSLVMNHQSTNEGGYNCSDLRRYLKGFAFNSMFDEIREIMIPFHNGDLLRIPTAEEMFGPEESHKYYESLSNKKQWRLMKDRHNRITFREETQIYEFGWLQNKVLNTAADFACVGSHGLAYGTYASNDHGVRVVFGLKK